MASDFGTVGFDVGQRRYLNVTNRCTLNCRFCPHCENQYEVLGHDLRLAREPSLGEIVEAIGDPRKYDEVVFSGLGEPTLRLYDILEATVRVRRAGVRVRLVTDGLANLVFGRAVVPDLEGLIDEIWISLNAQDEATYAHQCRPGVAGAYDAVLEFCAEARDYLPQVTLTAVMGVDGVDLDACETIASRLGVHFHRRQPGELL